MALFSGVLLVVVGVLASGVVYLAWRNRPRSDAVSLAGMMLSVALWAVAHLLEHQTTGGMDVLFENLGVVTLAPRVPLLRHRDRLRPPRTDRAGGERAPSRPRTLPESPGANN